MNSSIQLRMLSAVYACLLPLARMMLRSGITYRQFDAVARRAFVREALGEADARGRLTNTSRVAVQTGLSRKEVKRIREVLAGEPADGSGPPSDQSGPLARVLHAWHFDRRFVTPEGQPRDLAFLDESSGFFALVRAVAGDVPPGAVRAELKRAGAVIELDDGRLRAVKRYYVPGNVDEKAIITVSGMVFPLAAGLAHNTDPSRTSDGFIQRFAFSQGLNQEAIEVFRKWSRLQAVKFIENMDDWLAENETAEVADGSVKTEQAQTVGMGVFYYEGPSADDAVNRARPAQK